MAAGTSVTITGVAALAEGTYGFYCTFHPQMRGTLVVEGRDGTRPAAAGVRAAARRPEGAPGDHVRIAMRKAGVRMLPTDARTRMWTYGGSYPGPDHPAPGGRGTRR